MRSTRITAYLTCAALLATVFSGVGSAAVKKKPKPPPPSCNLVKDPADDAWFARTPNTVAMPDLDILSADVASDGVTLSAVIRLKQLTPSDNYAPTGREWSIGFASGNDRAGFDAVKTYEGEFFNGAKGTFDYAKSEIRFSEPVSKFFHINLAKGAVIDRIEVVSWMIAGLPSAAGFGAGPPEGGVIDQADSLPAVRYTVGKPSCLKVGS